MDKPSVDIHTHRRTGDKNHVELFQADYNQTLTSDCLCSIGIHPWQLDDAGFDVDFALQQVETNISNVSALGEVGLDKVHSSTFDLQKEVFEKQIMISEKYRKPLIIHNVHATNEILKLRKTSKAVQPWIMHGFVGNAIMAQQLVRAGFYVSVGKAVSGNGRLAEAVQSVPLDRLFLETDVADISIEDVYSEIATLRAVSVEELKEAIYLNFKRLFCND